MRQPLRALTAESMRFKTSMAARRASDAVDAVREYESDTRRDERLAAHECRTCCYINGARIGGAAMTTWFCGLCGVEALNGSTATPALCDDCAATHHLCATCGGDVETRTNRRSWPVAKPAPLPDKPTGAVTPPQDRTPSSQNSNDPVAVSRAEDRTT